MVTGSRNWTDYGRIRQVLKNLDNIRGTEDGILVSGNCPDGADAYCERYAISLGWQLELYPANWNLGKHAGYLRNQRMVDSKPEMCIAFIKAGSKGASMTAKLAEDAGIPTIRFEEN